MTALNPTEYDPAAYTPLPGPVVRPTIKPQPGATPAQTVRNVIDAVRTSHNRFLAEVEPLKPVGRPDDKLTEAGWEDLHNGFVQASTQFLDQAAAIIEAREAQAEQDYANTLAAQHQKLDTSGELRVDRALRRADTAVRNAADGQVSRTVKRVIAEADDETRGALIEELPDVLAQRGLPTSLVAEAAEAAIPELADAAKKVVKARQSKALLGAEIKREREAQARRGRPYVGHSSPEVVAKYDPDRK